ncbi:MAG TPA: hypothetical protein VIR02_17095 [Anaerolineales bacterium]
MDKLKATELVELGLQALRDLEEAILENRKHTINLKTAVLRETLFNILELTKLEQDD